MQDIVEEWAKLNKMTIEGWLGSGDFGEAYLTDCGKVIKITTDEREFIKADSLIGQSFDNVAEIYQMSFYKNNMIILQEYLEEDSNVENLFYELYNIMEQQEASMGSIDIEDIEISEDAKKLYEGLTSAIYEIENIGGFTPRDIRAENIGVKSSGEYGLFDQKDLCSNFEEELKDIQKKYEYKIVKKKRKTNKKSNLM